MSRMDLISPRQRGEKTFWVRVGTAFPRDKGGYQLVFDALPLPDAEGRVSVLMVEPQQREQPRQEQRPARQEKPSLADDLDDSIPF